MKYLTLKEKRFLIVWVIAHTIALLVNILQLSFYTTYDDDRKLGLVYYLTSTDEDTKQSLLISNFWPLVNPFINERGATGFNGLFCFYDFSEYLIYVLGAFLYFPLKRIWIGEPKQNNP